MGPFYDEKPKGKTKLISMIDEDAVLEGPIASIRPHVAGVILHLLGKKLTFLTMDAYRILEIFLGEDQSLQSIAGMSNPDLLILLLGFGDPPNRYLPELILQVLSRRQLIRKPTWVVLGLPVKQVAGRYNEALGQVITKFKPVTVK